MEIDEPTREGMRFNIKSKFFFKFFLFHPPLTRTNVIYPKCADGVESVEHSRQGM